MIMISSFANDHRRTIVCEKWSYISVLRQSRPRFLERSYPTRLWDSFSVRVSCTPRYIFSQNAGSWLTRRYATCAYPLAVSLQRNKVMRDPNSDTVQSSQRRGRPRARNILLDTSIRNVQRRIHWLYSHAIALNICHRQQLGIAGYIKSLHMACTRHLQTYIMYFLDTSAAETRHEENVPRREGRLTKREEGRGRWLYGQSERTMREASREAATRRKYPTENQPRFRKHRLLSEHVIWSSHSRSPCRDSSGDSCVRSNAEEIFNVMIISDSLESQARVRSTP